MPPGMRRHYTTAKRSWANECRASGVSILLNPNPAEPEPKGFVQKLAILLFGKRICFVQYLMREIQLTGLFSRHGVENFPHKVLTWALPTTQQIGFLRMRRNTAAEVVSIRRKNYGKNQAAYLPTRPPD
jgi:hypothetical protein